MAGDGDGPGWRGHPTTILISRPAEQEGQLRAALERQNAFLRALQQIALAANEAPRIEDAIAVALRAVCEQTGWPVGHAYLPGEDGLLSPSGIWYLSDPERSRQFQEATAAARLHAVPGLTSEAFQTGRAIWLTDLGAANFKRMDAATACGLRSGLSFPVLAGQEVVAALEFFSEQPEEPDDVVLDMMGQVSAQLARVVERSRAAAQLRQSEHLFRTLIERGADLIVVVDERAVISYASPSHEHILGYPPSALVGAPGDDLLHPDDKAAILSTLHQVIETPGASARAEYRLRAADGSYRHFAAVGRNLLDDPVVRGIVINSLEITERRRAEEALRRSESRFRAIYEGAAIGIALLRRERGIVAANPALQEMLGYTEEEFRRLSIIDRVHPDDLSIDNELFEELASGRRSQYMIEKRYLHKDGRVIWGRLTMANVGGGQEFPEIIATLEDISEQKEAEARVLHDALHDPLTGLPNRTLFMDRLEHSLARATRQDHGMFAVLFLDLDRFKIVNDSLGHMAGDQLLISVAERLQHCIRPGDTVARLGGDEFTVLLDDIHQPHDARRVADRIQAALATPVLLEGIEIVTPTSIGIAISAAHYRHAEELLRDADAAMYHAKALGCSRSEVFDARMHTQAVSRLQLEADLRGALARDELLLHYQPVISLATGRIGWCEALVRWQHPARGLLAPGEFIPIAEETGLIYQIGDYVLREACRQARDWQERFSTREPLAVSVNLSGKQLGQPELVDQVQHALAASGLAPSSLHLEITEGTLMANTDAARLALRELKALGVQLHLDDFGTGYSSLSLLHSFPLDTLKIDHSFVRQMDARREGAVVRAIVALGASLGLSVVAEGIETPEQLAQLRAMGCDHGQGYLFAATIEPQQVSELLARDQRW